MANEMTYSLTMYKVESKTSVKMANMGLLSAAFVVLWHCGFGGITHMSVPYFFLAAGYFLAGHIEGVDWWKREVGKRFHSLVIPMWIWGFIAEVISILLILIMQLVGCQGQGKGVSYSYRFIRAAGLLFTEHMGVYWFLRALFIFVVITPLFQGGGGYICPVSTSNSNRGTSLFVSFIR